MIKTFDIKGQVLIEFSLCCFLLFVILVACGNFYYLIITKIYCNKIVFEKTRASLYQKEPVLINLFRSKKNTSIQITENHKSISGVAKCNDIKSNITFQKLNQISF